MPAGPPREKIKVYTHTLGGALRGAGKHEFDDRFDAIPLVVIAEVPNRVAADLNKHGQLYQHVVAHVSKTMQAMIRDKDRAEDKSVPACGRYPAGKRQQDLGG
ncbi:hypothetical protein NHF48_008965 [Sphingomonas sp. H160509]|uniref:hypothetical protein n=1 Tax=Sphingomonas sp. H160509 TaxID=2955313 RepID=UPI00209830E5|nr:hypothetical protein [Sphingomonas sp. H160509]MDD1451065.1 hypothetical protein [Sphingomonas sp. H160509]